MSLETYIDYNRQAVQYPDRVLITRPGAGGTVSTSGVYTPSVIENLTYNGSIYIPVRLDPSRAFRPDHLREQEVTVNEYLLHLPKGFDLRPDDQITLLQPERLSVNDHFLEGLTGWSGPTVGITYQEVKAPGVRLVFEDTTPLLQQEVASGLDGEIIRVIAWVEVSEGSLTLVNPVLDIILTGNSPVEVIGVHAGITDFVQLEATATARGHAAILEVFKMKANRVFEVRKSTDASQFDVTAEFLVSEMEFQHTDG